MKWEYKVVATNPKYRADGKFERKLNDLGHDDWELIGVQTNALYFKRLDKAANEADLARFWREQVGCAPPF